MITGPIPFSPFLMQKFPIVIDKACSPAILQQFKTQTFRVITVLLYIAPLSLHLRLLMAAVIGKQTDPRMGSFLYYTPLSVICKLIFIVIILFPDQLVLPVKPIQGRPFLIRFSQTVPRLIIGIADRSAVAPLFQKLSPNIITVRNIQRITACSDSGCDAAQCRACLCAYFGRTVPVAVILVRKGEQYLFSCFGLQSADISVPVIGIRCLHAVAIADSADAVQGVISVPYFQTLLIIDAASSAQNVIGVTGTYPRRVLDLRDLPRLVIGIGN